MQRGNKRAWTTLVTVTAAPIALLRLAWLPGVGPAGLPHALAVTSPDRSLPLVLALAMTGFALWLAATVVAALAAEAPGALGWWARAALHGLAPAAVRRILAMTLGLTIATSAAGVAQAAGPVSHAVVTQARTAPTLSLDWPVTPAPVINLDRPAPVIHHDPGRGLHLVTSVPSKAPKVPAVQTIPGQTVTVRPGDSLWRIAARALPKGTASEVVERSWRRWYAANRAVIGPDPSLIQPGQHLTPPAP